MKRIFYLTLVVLAFTACKKKKSPEPVDDFYHYWSLDFYSRPFSTDPAWKPSILMSTGRTTFTLSPNGTYSGTGMLEGTGTFTEKDSAEYKILTMTPERKLYVRVISDQEMLVDTHTGKQDQSYTRFKFGLLKN